MRRLKQGGKNWPRILDVTAASEKRSEIIKTWCNREEEQEKFYMEKIKQVQNFYLEKCELSHLKSQLMHLQNQFNRSTATAMSSTATAMSSTAIENEKDITEVGTVSLPGVSNRRRESELKNLNFLLRQKYNYLKEENRHSVKPLVFFQSLEERFNRVRL